MSERLEKKIRRGLKAHIKCTALEALNAICEEKLFTRLKYALKLIFKYKLGERLKNG